MIIWLSSYPRSGNTLVRTILHHVFDIQTYSKYNDVHDLGAHKDVAKRIGHINYEGEWSETLTRFQAANEHYLIKTHEEPEDQSPAIYVVRHGFAALVSYWHYVRDFNGREIPHEDLISGKCGPFVSWGSHLDAWDVLRRPNTLLMRYEDLLSQPDAEIARIAEFLKATPLKVWQNNFAEMKRVDPRFFRLARKNIRKSELSEGLQRLFRIYHGDWLHNLGYETVPELVVPRQVCKQLRLGVTGENALPSVTSPVIAKQLEKWAREAEHRCSIEKKRADEATAWAEQAEQRAIEAKKLAITNEKWARSSDTRLEKSIKDLAALQAWANAAERRAAEAKKIATDYEKWALVSDAKLAEANARISSLEKYLQDHRQWALRCEEEIKALKSQRQKPSP